MRARNMMCSSGLLPGWLHKSFAGVAEVCAEFCGAAHISIFPIMVQKVSTNTRDAGWEYHSGTPVLSGGACVYPGRLACFPLVDMIQRHDHGVKATYL